MSTIHIPKPSKEAFISERLAKKKFAPSETLYVGTSCLEEATTFRSMLKFDLKPIPKDCSISSAKLNLFVSRNDVVGESQVLDLHALTDRFHKHKVTWKLQPAFAPPIESSAPIYGQIGRLVQWDITTLVQQWLAGKLKNRGIMMKARNEDQEGLVAFDSSLAPKFERRPHLIITLAEPQHLENCGKDFCFNVERGLISSDSFRYSLPHDLASVQFYSFLIQNKGAFPLTIVGQVRQDNAADAWVNVTPPTLVAPGDQHAVTTKTRSDCARLAFKSTIPGQRTVCDIWFQSESS